MHSFFKRHVITSRLRHLQSGVFQPSGHYISSLFIIDKSLKATQIWREISFKTLQPGISKADLPTQHCCRVPMTYEFNHMTNQKRKNLFPSATCNPWGEIAKMNSFACCVVFHRRVQKCFCLYSEGHSVCNFIHEKKNNNFSLRNKCTVRF